jgi:diguanylate cyclase (GGDEF)-like protein/PAS domain S-box-containing protein
MDEGLAVLQPGGAVLDANACWRRMHRALIGHGSAAERDGWPSDPGPVDGANRGARDAYRKHFSRCDGRWLELPSHGGRWLHSRFQQLGDETVLAVLRDITDLHDRELELCSSVERFRAYAESSGDWLWELDAELRCTHASANLRESQHVDPQSLIGSDFVQRLKELAMDPAETKPLAHSLLTRAPFRELELRLRDCDGEALVTSLSGTPISDAKGSFAGFRGIGRNVTEAHELASRLAYQATHDDLTGLANRRALEEAITRLLSRRGDDDSDHALCFLDVDQIKVINDTCGHAAGDALLNRVARMLGQGLHGADTVARLGGDEFGVLLRDCDPKRAHEIAQKIRGAIQKRPFTWEGQQFRITVSIGVAPLGDDLPNAAEVMRAADSACYAAKEGGRNRVKLYSLVDSTLNLRKGEMHWVARIHSALAEKRLELYAQPIVPTLAGPGEYRHFEVLLRMNGRDGRCFAPGAFLPAAERYNLASQIDSWVLEETLSWLDRAPLFLDHLHVLSVNLSGQSLGEQAFRSHVRERVRRNALAARKLCFEITETAAISNLEPVQEFMKSMREFGCSFALDDFGAGLSSFAYLRTLDVDYLKIDGMFVKDLDDDPIHLAMVRSINEVGHVMGKKTIAEFVESEAIRERLAGIGVDMVQGFAIGEPAPFADFV